MRPRRRNPGLLFQPGRARVVYQPLGVVGVIGPWNYPIQLNLLPLLGALAAGNRVMLKPSEYTPKTSALLEDLIGKYFNPQEVTVVNGDASVAAAFARLPFDHLFFTGSTSVGQKVMAAAAQNLTPVTLELGGKSPAIIDDDFSLTTAAERIVRGKLMNGGQTCIAPDYVLLPKNKQASFVEAVKHQVAKMYPTYVANADYTSIISERHRDRLNRLVDEAKAAGVEVVAINPAGDNFEGDTRKLPLRLLLEPTDGDEVMRDEIFGPILPIIGYETLGDAIRFVNDRPRPLALYFFSDDDKAQERVIEETVSRASPSTTPCCIVPLKICPLAALGPVASAGTTVRIHSKSSPTKKAFIFKPRLTVASSQPLPFGGAVETLLKLFVR